MQRKVFLTQGAHIVTHNAATGKAQIAFSKCKEASESCRYLIRYIA